MCDAVPGCTLQSTRRHEIDSLMIEVASAGLTSDERHVAVKMFNGKIEKIPDTTL
jgi:hypothetical protein